MDWKRKINPELLSSATTMFPNLPTQSREPPDPITDDDLIRALDRSIHAARGLLDSAHVVFAHGHWHSAVALGLQAWEEAVKYAILDGIRNSDDADTQRTAWKDLFRHHAKHPFFFTNAPKMDMRAVRELALYSNRTTEGAWVAPQDVFSQRDAERVLTLADHAVSGWRHIITFTRPIHRSSPE